ncbi:MAG: general secretion pathway protein GspB [Desulfobacula sp.]|jgi:hypothetical protein|nr:general secretion pathway protein GspB [Desulfobacula sp.]
MSTILKALKQAEKDSPDQGDDNRPSFNVQTTLSSRMRQQERSSFSSLGRVVILMALALAIVMVIFSYSLFFNNKKIHPQMPQAKQSQVLETQPGIVKDQKPTFAEPVIKISDLPELANKTILKPEPVNKVPVGESFSNQDKDKDKDKESIPSKPPNTPKTIPNDNTPLIAEESILSRSAGEDLIKDEKELLNEDTPKQETLLPLENDSLRVQAISWAKEPASRVAVIDNRVLKEGDSVQGYRLVIIKKDSVILHYSGIDYRLGFQYR